LRENLELVYCNGIKYSIDLVEETSPGIYKSAPWRDDSVSEIVSLLEKRLFEKIDDIESQSKLQFVTLPILSS
jgi:hypothetical protein